MKFFLLAALLLPATAGAQPCTPTTVGPCAPDDIRELRKPIMSAVNDGLAAQKRMKSRLNLSTQASNNELRLKFWSDARDSEREMQDDFNRAIQLTQETYHLTPPASEDPRARPPSDPHGAWSANIPAPWTPRFRISEYRAIVGSDGRTHYVSDNPGEIPGNNTAAVTDPDGVATIFLLTMERVAESGNTGILASAVHHESQHYRDLVTSGWDTHERGEIRAFTASLAAADAFFPPGRMKETFVSFYKQLIATYQKDVDSGNEHSPFPNEDQETQYKDAFEKQLAQENQYQNLVKLVAKEKQDERDRLAQLRRDTRWQKFRLWTLDACVYIDGVHQNDPEWGNPDAIRSRDDALRTYLRSNLVVMVKDEIDAGLKRDDLFHGGSIGTCQEQVVEMIRDLPGPVDEDWMMNKIEYERNGGRAGEIISGVINSVHQAVLDGTAAIVETLTAPFTAERGSGGGGNSGGGNDRSGGGNTRMPDIDKLPYQQLRGISAHGW